MSELRETYERLRDEQPHGPSAETIRLHAEGCLEGAEARRVALHLNDCASCVGLLERLDPVDSPELPPELQQEMAGEIDRRLGFEAEEPEAGSGEGRFGRLLRFRVPALVPLAVAALALALVWWVGGGTGPAADAPPVIQQLSIFTIDQTLSRSGADTGGSPAATSGVPFILEVVLYRLDLAPGERLRFAVTDDAGRVVIEGDTAVLEDYNIRLALTFANPGSYTVILADGKGAEVESVKIAVAAAG